MMRVSSLMALLLSAVATAQGVDLLAVDMRPQPFVAFASRSLGSDVLSEHYIVFPDEGEATLWLRYRGTVVWHARPDIRHVIVGLYGRSRGLYVCDLAAGTKRKLGGNPHGFVGMRGGDVIVQDGRQMLAVPWTVAREPEVLGEVELERGLLVGDHVVGLNAKRSRLLAVDLATGSERTVQDLPEGVKHVQLRESPDGQHLCVAYTGESMSVQVLALPSMRVLWSDDQHMVRAPLTLVRGLGAGMRLAWLDTQRLAYAGGDRGSVSFVYVRAVADGALSESDLGAEVFSDGFVRLDELTDNGRKEVGAFAANGSRLFLRSGKAPIATDSRLENSGDILLIDDGRFAIERKVDDQYCLDVIDGQGTRRRVFDGWTDRLEWVKMTQ